MCLFHLGFCCYNLIIQEEVNNMWETLIWLLAGAVLGFLPTWFLSNRSHKWELEQKKLERIIAAREVRFKEGEEKINEYTNEYFYLFRLFSLIINFTADSTLLNLHQRYLERYTKLWEEGNKETAINEVSVKSLEDEQLSKSWERVFDSFNEYKTFFLELERTLTAKGMSYLQKEHDENVKKELDIRLSYLSSVTEFLSRINELRSQ